MYVCMYVCMFIFLLSEAKYVLFSTSFFMATYARNLSSVDQLNPPNQESAINLP